MENILKLHFNIAQMCGFIEAYIDLLAMGAIVDAPAAEAKFREYINKHENNMCGFLGVKRGERL